jgi:DUF4097 and DUF4098 domain-containing protein YvlB
MSPSRPAPPMSPPLRRRHSIAGPLILIMVGVIFLFRNYLPHIAVWEAFRDYWPFALILLGVVRAAEVLWTFFRTGEAFAYRGMGFGQVILLVVACLAIAAATQPGMQLGRFHSGGIDLFGEQFDYPITISQPAGDSKRLILENLRGNVTVSGGDGTEVHIEGRKTLRAYNRSAADSAARHSELRLVQEGEQLVLRSDESNVGGDVRISTDIDITVPRRISIEAHGRPGDLTVNTINGDVNVSGQRGEVRLTGIGGNAHIDLARSGLVRASDVKGDVQLEGRGSDIQLENIAGQVTISGVYSGTMDFRNLAKPLHFQSERTDLRVAQVPGNITMDLSDFRANNVVGPVRLVTRSRDIHMEDFTDSLELEVERGDIELKPGKATPPKMDVHARNGNVELQLPAGLPFNLKASSMQGEVRNDYGDGIETLGEGRTSSLRSVHPSGSEISLTTDHGSVSVSKL